MRSIQDKKYGYIVNFWFDGEKRIRGDEMGGRIFKVMNKAALSNEAIAERVELYKYRVPEELYDFKNDPDGWVNLINDPNLQDEIKRLKELLYAEMKRTDDPNRHEFEKRFLQEDIN